MVKKKGLIGSRFYFGPNCKRKYITLKAILEIRSELIQGKKLNQIYKKFDIMFGMYDSIKSKGFFDVNFKDFSTVIETGNSFIKKENDISEEELLNEKNYKFQTLTIYEKQFYIEYGNRTTK